MDISSVQENNQTGRSSSPKQFTSEPEHEFDPKGRCSEVEEQKHDTAENAQKGSAEARVLESISSSVEQLKHPEDSTKNLCCEPLWRPQQDATISSLKQIESLAEGATRKTSCPKQTSDLNHEFGSESLNSQPLEQKQVIDIETVQNGPVEVQKAECDNLCLEHVGRPPEEVTRKSCRDRSQPEDLTMKCGIQLFGLPLEVEATNSNLEESGPQPDDVSKNQDLKQLDPKQEDAATNSNLKELGPPLDDASKNQDLEQLGPTEEEATQNTSQSGHRKKGSSGRPKKGKNILKSLVSTRVLRSRSQEKSKAPELSQNLPDDGSNREKKRKKKKRLKNVPVNEFSRIRTHLRYLLTRMNYEQNLIDAYSGEGWKGQSLEKIKPEKELQRAKSEIFRCKLKIRDLFQRLDTSCAEGKLPESLFDSEGEIDSEDIFCAKCGSKELLVNNDIILCDGACERAFHQFCLEPPLLKEDIPPDDEGWLCPGCDCKVDCIDLLNDSQETNLSIRNSWEKVFPEAAAGNNLDDKLGFSSDDSEDDDYNPDGPELEEEVQGDESSCDESDFSSASDDLGVLPNNEQYLGLPSDDSEDDDYNPNGQDLDEQVKQESSSSDFTSDSEDFSVAFDDNRPSGEVQGPMFSTSDHIKPNGERSKMGGTKRQSLSDELFSLLDSGPGEGDTVPLSGKRHVERLDYKKLHDETYGNVSSDSSDEEYMDTAIPKRRKIDTGKVALVSPNRKTANVPRGTRAKDMKHKQKETELTPKRRTNKNPDVDGTSNSPAKSHKGSSGPHSSGTKSAHKRLGEAVTQRLLESFEENKYPERAVKENLAKELSLTVRQVSKWFENARWSFHHSSRTESKIAESALNKGTIIDNELPGPEPRMVTEDNARNVFKKSESPKASPVVIQGCSGNVTEGKLVTKEGNGQNSRTPKSKKRKAKLDNQTDLISSMMEETPKQNVEVNPPKAKGLEVRRSGRIQSRSGKSVA